MGRILINENVKVGAYSLARKLNCLGRLQDITHRVPSYGTYNRAAKLRR